MLEQLPPSPRNAGLNAPLGSGNVASPTISGCGQPVLSPMRMSLSVCSSKADGHGSIRLGTPVIEERAAKAQQARQTYSGLMQPTRSSSTPAIRTPPKDSRSGFMPPEAGRLQRSKSSQSAALVQGLSPELSATIFELFSEMDRNGDGSIILAEAEAFFHRFGGVSADAMFKAVDDDGDNTVTLDEFLAFWVSVKRSGYSEEELLEELGLLLEGNAWVEFETEDSPSYGKGSLRGIKR